MRPCTVVLLASLVLNLEAPAPGQEIGISVGSRVVTKAQTPLMIGERVVDDGKIYRVYEVRQVDGPRLRIESGEVLGWVLAEQVIPFGKRDEPPGRKHMEALRGQILRYIGRFRKTSQNVAIRCISA